MTYAFSRLFLTTLAATAALSVPLAARVQAAERSGKEVVDAVCAACHAKGVNGAPKIGDRKAWGKRAEQGLTSLTENALKGIRGMPSHGGKMDLTDLEIGRAVAYMVNQSGGKWVEPATAQDMMAERSGEQVVKGQCIKCHEKGVGGAPKIGDRKAWAPRLKQGMDALVASAIRGHGGMPPRGDKADLTDNEIRAAVNYMYNPSAPAKGAPAAAPVKGATSDRAHKLVSGTDVYLGLLPASAEKGAGYYHVSIVLRDHASKAEIKDAQVEGRVANLITGETKPLEPTTANNAFSYGNYFQMPGKDPYTLTLKIRKAGAPAPIETKFDLKH